MTHHQYQCDSPGCPTQLATIGFTQVKKLAIEHDCLGSDMILYYLMCWYLCQAIPFNKYLTSTELVTHALLYLNEDQREEVGEKTRLQRTEDYHAWQALSATQQWASVGFLVTSPQSVSWVIARDQLGGVVILQQW
ncbi:hypothetical protein DSO57_1023249 [Entomophthora muscae]|uniref:Uncharacterized protein n=1 Tax=Entomophthora muscae TaxID=34485 RepID=A0ACC2S4X4_9FUNG|nr:hypothetical protein DSO57_1023249 [Entomophthora muscae]